MSNAVTVNKVEAHGNKDQGEVKQTNAECEVNYDELISSAGEFGKYQMLMLLSTLPFYMFGVFVYFSQMFITESSQNHWCWIPELQNLTIEERRTLAIPKDDSIFGYSRCTAYMANWTEVLQEGLSPNNTWDTAPCQHGWEFDKTEIPYPTISSEQGWVCDKGSYQATAQSLFSVGAIIGGFIMGWIADRYGRIPAVVVSNMLGCIGGVSSTFTKNFVQFSICRLIMGMSYDNCMLMVYLIILEYIAPKYRSMLANISFAVFYALFATTLPFIALALGHWKLISLATSLPLALAIFTPLLIPESPRWLLSKGRIDDAVQKVLVIGRINKKEVPSKLIEQFKTITMKEKTEVTQSLSEVFKRPVLRRVLFLVCLEFICCNIVFDGLVRSVGQLGFDFFISFAAVSFTELPSVVLMALIMDYFGRRWLSSSMMAISCIFCLLTAFVGNGVESVCCAVMARFTVNMAYGTALQWVAEVLPTGVRGSGMSLAHICGYASTAITPYIVYLGTYIYWLPLVVIGCIAGMGAVVALFIPETSKKEMPHTFDDAEYLARTQQFWELPCLKKLNVEDVVEQVNPSFEM